MSEKLSSLYVEILTKGMNLVNNSINKVKEATKAPVQLIVDAKNKSFKSIGDAINNAKDKMKSLGSTLSTVASNINKGLTASFSALRKISDTTFSGISKATSSFFTSFNAGMNRSIEMIKTFGASAQKYLLLATGSMFAFSRSADPRGFALLQGTLAAISVQIGSIFIPQLQAMQRVMDSVLSYLRSLTNEEKTFISTIATAVVTVLAFTVAFTKLAPILSGVFTVIKVIGSVIGLIGGSLGLAIPIILALGAAFIATQVKIEDLVEAFEYIKTVFKPLIEVLITGAEKLINAFKPAVEPILNSFKSILAGAKKIFEIVVEVVTQLVGAIIDATIDLAPTINSVMETISTIIETLVPVVVGAIKIMAAGIKNSIIIISKIIEILAPVVESIANAIQSFVDSVATWLESLNVIFGGLIDSLFGIEETTGSVFQTIANSLTWVKSVFDVVFTGIMTVINAANAAFIFHATLLKNVLSGNFRNAFSEAKKSVDDYYDRLEERERARMNKKYSANLPKKKEEKEKEKSKFNLNQETKNHAGNLMQKVEFTGITELWKKAMQSQIESPEMRRNQEILNTQKQQLDENKKANNLLSKIAGEDKQVAIFGA